MQKKILQEEFSFSSLVNIIINWITVRKLSISIRGTLLVAQLVEALRYNPEGRGFDSRWLHRKFSLT